MESFKGVYERGLCSEEEYKKELDRVAREESYELTTWIIDEAKTRKIYGSGDAYDKMIDLWMDSINYFEGE